MDEKATKCGKIQLCFLMVSYLFGLGGIKRKTAKID
jgi:hypothetical protein